MKLKTVSILRIVAMLMVVFYHCLFVYFNQYNSVETSFPHIDLYEHVGKFLHSVDMPLFVFLSGFLYAFLKLKKNKYTDELAFLKQKSKRLILPFVVWTFVVCLFVYQQPISVTDFLCPVCHLWFLVMLMECFILSVLLRKVWSTLSLNINVILLVFFVGLHPVLSRLNMTTEFLSIESFLLYYPVFYLSILSVRFDWYSKVYAIFQSRKIMFAISILVVLLFIGLFTDGSFRYSSDTLSRYCAWVFVFFLSCFLIGLEQENKITLPDSIEPLDKSCMGIYLIHQVVIIKILQVDCIAMMMAEYCFVSPILLFVIAFSVSWLLTYIISKTFIKFILG